MKILLFGSQGMLGNQFFCDASEIFEIIPLSRFQIDFLEYNKISELIASLAPDVVINTAAWTDVDKAENPRFKKDVFAINASAPEAMANTCHNLNIPFLHISTDFVFSGVKGDVFTEESVPNPINVYGKSKQKGEELIMKANPRSWIMRTAWLFGQYGGNFVEKILHTNRKKLPLSVIADQFGSPSFAEDVVKSMVFILQNRPAFGIYHSVNEGIASKAELASEIFHNIGIKNAIIESTTKENRINIAPRPECSALKNTKLPLLPHWHDALKRYLVKKGKKFS
jgi:dTDP-4-dehydrorhamnose reductase